MSGGTAWRSMAEVRRPPPPPRRNAARRGRTVHAYLCAGPRGTGKTTTARLLAKALNCLAEGPAERPCNACANCQSLNDGRVLDLIEIDAAPTTSAQDG